MSKIMLGASLATGYVLGARAGRERYDQIHEQAQRLWGNPAVQAQASKVTSVVDDALPDDGGDSAGGAHVGTSSGSSGGSRRSRGRRSRRGPRPQAPPVVTAEDVVLHDDDPLVYSTGPAVTANTDELAQDEPGR